MQRRKFIQRSIGVTALASTVAFDVALARGFEAVKKSPQVINAGVGGNNSADLLARMDRDCLSHNPGLTILMVGTNDMNSRKFIPLKEYEKNLHKLIEGIRKSGSKIVLMNLLPVYEPYLMTRHDPAFYEPEGHRGRLDEMNDCIRKAAKKYRLSFLDLFSVYEKAGNVGLDKSSWIKNEANSNGTDGLHPTAEGYRVMGVLVHQHIIQNDLVADKIVCFGDSITRGDGSMDKNSYPAWLQKLLA